MTDRMKWAIKLALRLFSLFMIFVIFVGLLVLGPGGIGSFFDLRSFFCTALLPIPLVLFMSGKAIVPFLWASLPFSVRERKPNPQVVYVCRIFRRCVVGCAAISFVVMLIGMLRMLQDPCQVGAGMVSSILFLFWPIAINYLVISPIEAQFTDCSDSQSRRLPERFEGILLPLFAVGVVLTLFFILLMNFSTPDASELLQTPRWTRYN